jgi:HEPN domain-containing protein
MYCKNDNSIAELDFVSGNFQCPNPIDPIIHVICHSMQTEKIFLLGTYIANPQILGLEYDLLVMINSEDKRPMHEYESLIANRCHDFAMVTSSVYKIGAINQLLKEGNIFFSTLCAFKNLVFDRYQTNLSIAKSHGPKLNYDSLKNEFSNLITKSKAFLSGAINYKITHDYQLAAFMLHQTVEQSMNAFLSPLMGYRIQTHNLNKLFIYARRFSAQFYDIFPRNTDKEIQLYQTLHKAYIYGRYKNNFVIGEEILQTLIERTTALLEKTESIFHDKLCELNERPLTNN